MQLQQRCSSINKLSWPSLNNCLTPREEAELHVLVPWLWAGKAQTFDELHSVTVTLFSWRSCAVIQPLVAHWRGSKVVGVWLLQWGGTFSLSHQRQGRILCKWDTCQCTLGESATGVGWGDVGQPFQTSPHPFLRYLLNLGVLMEPTSRSRKKHLSLASFLQHGVMLLNQESLFLGPQEPEWGIVLLNVRRTWLRKEWMGDGRAGGRDTAPESILTTPKANLVSKKHLFLSTKVLALFQFC